MSGKFALIIGNTEYIDPGLAQLTAPSRDAEDFALVLNDQEICAFDDVKVLLNQSSSSVIEAIDEFFDQKKSDDLLVLYFSGHGVRDELGSLYLAVKNTNRFRLRSTALKSDFIREAMDQSRSKRQVLILDCCNSGAFAQGTKAAAGMSIGTASAFEAGYGRIILTASDSTQFAWEGDKVIGETDNSLFTHFLVEGLGGEADLDGDGRITVDELYDYAYEKVKLATPKQTPSKFSSKQQGEIVLRQITRIQDIKPVSLSDQLISEIENPYPEVRLRAVQQLEKLLNGKNLGLARSAREALERLEKEDDSRRVSQAATQVLKPIRQAEKLEEERKVREEAEHMAAQKAIEEQLAAEKAEAERIAQEEAARSWAKQQAEAERIAIEKAEAERIAEERRSAFEKTETGSKAGEVAKQLSQQEIEAKDLAQERMIQSQKSHELAKQNENVKVKLHPRWISLFWITLGWAIGSAIGFSVGQGIGLGLSFSQSLGTMEFYIRQEIGTAVGWLIGWTIGGFATAIILYKQSVLSNRKSIFQITLAWAVGAALGGAINLLSLLLVGIELGSLLGPMLGSAIGWTIGGFVTATVLYKQAVLSNRLSIVLITLAWVVGWVIGRASGWGIFLASNSMGGLAIGWTISAAIGGLALVGRIRESKKET